MEVKIRSEGKDYSFEKAIIQSIQYNYGTQPSQATLSIPIIDAYTISLPKELQNINKTQDISLQQKDYAITISIDKTKVFGGIITDLSYNFSESGHTILINALDYRVLLFRCAMFGEYNNKDNPASLPHLSSKELNEYKPRWTATYILNDILSTFISLNGTLHFYDPEKLGINLKLAISDTKYFGEGNILKANSSEIEIGSTVFNGQSILEAMQTVIQQVGNYRLYCDPDATLWVTRAGDSTKEINCSFAENVISYDLNESVVRNTSVLVKGKKYYFSGQKEISLETDNNKFPNILIPSYSASWSYEKKKFIVGYELTPGWTDLTGDNLQSELNQPYIVALPDTGDKITPMVVEEWQLANDGKTIVGIKKAREMTVAEGVFFPFSFMLEGGIIYKPNFGIFQKWIAKDKNGSRIGLWRDNLFSGTTQDLIEKNGKFYRAFKKLSKNEAGDIIEEDIEQDLNDILGQKLGREINIGPDILVEKLVIWEDKVKGTIIRPSNDEYTIDYLKGEVNFKRPVGGLASTLSVILPYKYLSKYSFISNKHDLIVKSYNSEDFVVYTQSFADRASQSMKNLKAAPLSFPLPYILNKKDNTNIYWIPRVWATFYYERPEDLSNLTWTKQQTDENSEYDVWYAEEENYVLVQLKNLKSASKMYAINSDKIFEVDESDKEKGYYITANPVGSERFAETTYVFYHRDDRKEMAKAAQQYLEPNKLYSGTIKIVGTPNIALGPNLGKAILSGHLRYSGEAFIEGANLSFTDNGFLVTLELEKERFRLGREPEAERKRKIDTYHRLAQWQKSKYLKFTEPGTSSVDNLTTDEAHYNADP